jgi:integrase
MRRTTVAGIEKLSASKIVRLSKPGKYSDGKGLYLQITKHLTKSWIFRYQRHGVEHYMGLGSLRAVGLQEAREAAQKVRALLGQRDDPFLARAAGIQKRIPSANRRTFDECVDAYIASHRKGWRSSKHRKQWETSLRTYVSPRLGELDVRRIATSHVLEVLTPIWASRTETASRLRGRIERILSWAAISGYREGDNPARWRGCLQELLPNPSKVKKARHHPAMPYREIGAFYLRLEARPELAARALAFTILTACRNSEALHAKWAEIDFAQRLWTIPGERMKSERTHRVPLSDAALRILESLKGRDPVWIFPGTKPGRPVSDAVMLTVLRKMNCASVTVHGFRSTFRIWAAEQTLYPKEMAELALSHAVGSEVEQAYQRSDLFERRRALMRDWAAWCLAASGNEEQTASPAADETPLS